MIMKRAIDVVKENSTGTPGAWKKQAQVDIQKWAWKKYAFGIAIKARSKMELLGMTQKQLAEKMGCSQQYVSLLLKGNENLTLETIAKIETILEITDQQ
jgi:antitoxin component HigA of HigAB toxin-antitoxin module